MKLTTTRYQKDKRRKIPLLVIENDFLVISSNLQIDEYEVQHRSGYLIVNVNKNTSVAAMISYLYAFLRYLLSLKFKNNL